MMGNSTPRACAHRKEPQRAELHFRVRAHFRARDTLRAHASPRARTAGLFCRTVAKNLRGNIAPAAECRRGDRAAAAIESAQRLSGNTNLRGICLLQPTLPDHGASRKSAEC